MVQQMQLVASGIVPTIRWYYDEIHFSICILKLTITGLQHFHQLKESGLCNQTLSPCGWGLGTRLAIWGHAPPKEIWML